MTGRLWGVGREDRPRVSRVRPFSNRLAWSFHTPNNIFGRIFSSRCAYHYLEHGSGLQLLLLAGCLLLLPASCMQLPRPNYPIVVKEGAGRVPSPSASKEGMRRGEGTTHGFAQNWGHPSSQWSRSMPGGKTRPPCILLVMCPLRYRFFLPSYFI